MKITNNVCVDIEIIKHGKCQKMIIYPQKGEKF